MNENMAEGRPLSDDEGNGKLQDATPVCPHCLLEISPEQYYCHGCGECVGQLTGIIPFINIRFGAIFFGNLWRKAWFDKGADIRLRVLCALLVVLGYLPVVVIALPFLLWEKVRKMVFRK